MRKSKLARAEIRVSIGRQTNAKILMWNNGRSFIREDEIFLDG